MINISVLQEDLEKALSVVSRFIANKPQLPILSNILLSLEKGRVKLCATNLELGINYWLGVKVQGLPQKKIEKTAIPAKTLLDVISGLPPGKVDLKEEEGKINLSTGGTFVSIPTTPANEFPDIEYKPNKKSPVLEKVVFGDISKKVAFCAAGDMEVKPEYTGILFLPNSKGVLVVATDGVRLSQKSLTTTSPFPDKILLPAKTLLEISKVFTQEPPTVSIEENQVLFATEDIILTSRTLDAGKFPDFEKIIPKTWNLKASLDREEFSRAVHLSSIFARDWTVKLNFGSGECTLSSENATSGSQKTNVSAKIEGEEEMNVSFNWRFINDFLGSVDGDEVEIRLINPTSPGVFADPKDPDYLHLIMPIRTVTPEAEE